MKLLALTGEQLSLIYSLNAQSPYKKVVPARAKDGSYFLNADIIKECGTDQTWKDFWLALGRLRPTEGSIIGTDTAITITQTTLLPPVRSLPVGMWYFPGWKDQPNHSFGPPWDRAWWWYSDTRYPNRKPLQGLYDESQPVIDNAMAMAASRGVDFFMFNYYFNGSTKLPDADHALNNFIASSVTNIKFVIGFESQTNPPPITSLADFRLMLQDWKAKVASPKCLRIGGKPVISIIKMEHFHQVVSAATGMSATNMLLEIKSVLGEDVYFIACGPATHHWMNQAKVCGYNGYSQYNLSRVWVNRDDGILGTSPANYQQLTANYASEAAYQVGKLEVDFWVPMTAGFDSSPWGGGGPGVGTIPELEAHFIRQKQIMLSSPRCKGGIIYAWNEWGEGGWMEPSVVDGRTKLDVFYRVFG